MEQNLYNSNDEQYKHVINLLRELPKVNAENNFEYNLKVKIENKNFKLISEQKKSIFSWKIFFPVGSLATASLVVAIFFISNSQENFENPFQISPRLRTNISSNLANAQKNIINGIISSNDVILRKKLAVAQSTPTSKNNSYNYKSAKIKPKIAFPFKESNSTNLDEALNSENNIKDIDNRATLTSGGNTEFFDGFFMREQVDKKYVETLKARLDSLKREFYQKERR